MRLTKVTMLLASALGALGCSRDGGGAAPAASVAAEAPDFTLMGSDGKTHHLADYRGKVVVLAWFPKAFTSG